MLIPGQLASAASIAFSASSTFAAIRSAGLGHVGAATAALYRPSASAAPLRTRSTAENFDTRSSVTPTTRPPWRIRRGVGDGNDARADLGLALVSQRLQLIVAEAADGQAIEPDSTDLLNV